MNELDTYKTITKTSVEVLFKDKNSKFFGVAFPIKKEADVKAKIELLKKSHPKAGHFCYAYQIGTHEDAILYRANDDGEPKNSAGMPIYGQIQSFDITNALIVVIRYFGGTKLGVSGLINAYKTTAQMALEASKIVTKTINVHYILKFEYKNMNTAMRIIKEKNLKIINQQLEQTCTIEISVRLKKSQSVLESFDHLHGIDIQVLND